MEWYEPVFLHVVGENRFFVFTMELNWKNDSWDDRTYGNFGEVC